MTVEIPLTQGLVAIVDDVDADLAAAKWSAAKGHRTFYATRHVYRNGKRTTQSLHQAIAAKTGIPGDVDHRDRNGLNNTRENLRAATRSQNGANQGIHSRNSSGVKGVSWNKRDCVWQAKIVVNGRARAVGTFMNIAAAEEAIRLARERFFGEYACHG